MAISSHAGTRATSCCTARQPAENGRIITGRRQGLLNDVSSELLQPLCKHDIFQRRRNPNCPALQISPERIGTLWPPKRSDAWTRLQRKTSCVLIHFHGWPCP